MSSAVAVVLIGLVTGPAPARTARLSPVEALQRADTLYQAGKGLQAEALYRQALKAGLGGSRRRRCFERLLAIYARVGRQDQAIGTGLEYEGWLRRTGDAERARELDLDLGRWYVALGHYAAAEPYLHRALARLRGFPLSPAREVAALTYLALAAEKQGDRDRAGQAWREVETFARARLAGLHRKVDLPVRIECIRGLADSYRFQEQPRKAIPWLEQILEALDGLKKPDPIDRRDTLRQLANHLTAARRHAEAEQRLREALKLHKQHAAGDRLTQADLCCELADVLERRGRTKEAVSRREQATREYRAVLADSRAGRLELSGALAAFWKLQMLYQRTSQLDSALQLTQVQAGQWGGGLVGPRLHAMEGGLQVLRGEYRESLRLLAGAVSYLQKQSPPNLVELPAALLNLGVAELATGGRDRAEKAARNCLDLYRKHRLADDLVRVQAYNLLGTCVAMGGDYSQAIRHFRAGVDRCVKLGVAAYPPRCNLLLNIALLHKLQDNPAPALAACQKAREVYQRFAVPDALGFAALDAAAAALLAARARFAEAAALAPGILKRCERHGIRGGPLVMTACHCQALFALFQKDFKAAEQTWRKVEKLHGLKSPLQPRTLNYLALTQECQGHLDQAARLYEQARQLQTKNRRAFPATHFTTLWRLANLANRRDQRTKARALLNEAIAVIEEARLRTYGAAQQRAKFFAQFAPAFEQMVAWCVRDGDVAGAVVAAARGRSRTQLDQLLLANVDPLRGLQGEQGEKWRQQEAELRRRVATLRAGIMTLSPEELETREARQALKKLDSVQLEYNEVYREILDANPAYHSLARQFTPTDLKRLRDGAIGRRRLLLVYHVGRKQSHLLLVGDRSRRLEAFPLTVPADVAERVAPPAPVPLARALAQGRGVVLRPDRPQPELPRPQRNQGDVVPLGETVLRALVDNYLEQISDPTFQATRGVRLDPKDPARPLPAQRPEFLAQILLPPAAQKRIQALEPECLIVVPDGALHKLPFEALLLRAGRKPRYVLDELPPLIYAPSVAILALLADRKPAAPNGPQSLLTVADPAYPQGEKWAMRGGERQVPFGRSTRLGLWGHVPRLPHTAEESERISRFFDQDQVLALRGVKARERALTAALPGRHVVHIAAHGIADDDQDSQFWALVLTPPRGKVTPEDDGFLELHEIYTLPLGECELAVLSACLTNVGPQRPLEAGVTLAGGFLAAGARRVVASHWAVDDRSTAELMAAFFQKVRADTRAGQPVKYAQALQRARRQVRSRAGWSAPYFWAPFVLIGPAD